jgi:hypothetical protein
MGKSQRRLACCSHAMTKDNIAKLESPLWYTNENNYSEYEVGRVGFEPTTPAMSRLVQSKEDFWKGFESFLKQTNNHRSTRDRLN